LKAEHPIQRQQQQLDVAGGSAWVARVDAVADRDIDAMAPMRITSDSDVAAPTHEFLTRRAGLVNSWRRSGIRSLVRKQLA